jgi:hypothetical protein
MVGAGPHLPPGARRYHEDARGAVYRGALPPFRSAALVSVRSERQPTAQLNGPAPVLYPCPYAPELSGDEHILVRAYPASGR